MISSSTVSVMVGAGVAARMLLSNSLLGPGFSPYRVAAILDDRVELHGSSISGVSVIGGLEQLPRVLERYGAKVVIVAISRRDGVAKVARSWLQPALSTVASAQLLQRTVLLGFEEFSKFRSCVSDCHKLADLP